MKAWIERNKEKLVFSVVINIIVLISLLLIYRPAYETNDDIAMTTLVNGYKNVYDSHMIFIHRIIGCVLSVLYQNVPGIVWHAVLQYVLLFCAFTGVTYVFLNKLKDIACVPVVLLFLHFFAYEGYINLQFTKTAGILTVAGGTMLFWALSQKKVHKIMCVFGFVLALIGSFYRINQFMSEILLLTAMGVVFIFSLKEYGKKERVHRITTCILLFALLFAVGYGAYKLDMRDYNASEEWNYYLDYNKARAELLDFGFPNYEKNEEGYMALGIDKVTYRLFDKWTHQDPEKITLEVMNEIISMKEKKEINVAFVKKFASKMAEKIWKVNAFLCCIVLGFIWLFKGKKDLGAILAILYEAGLVVVLYFYLFYEGRYLRNRVDVGIWMAVAVLLLWLLDKGKKQKQKNVTLFLTTALMVGVVAVTSYMWRGDWRINQKDELEIYEIERAALEEIDQDDEHLYLTKIFTVSTAKAYKVFDDIPVGQGSNMYPLGGWTAQTGSYMAVLDDYGVYNPFRDMINNDKIYIVDIDIDLTMEYINNWYDENAEAVFVKNLGQYPVYKVVSE